MKMCVVGAGYVGLVTGACFAERGNSVTCVDVNSATIASLRQGVIPIYEPGLDELVGDNTRQQRLHFTTSLAEGLADTGIVFVAVGTPPGEDGSADLQHVLAVAAEIGRHITDYIVVVNKSTVPVGTATKVRAAIQAELDKRGIAVEFDVVSNPEFLKEGSAIEDFMRPPRVVIGADSERALQVMRELCLPFVDQPGKLLCMGVPDAEMTKYAANAMLATRISFMNEVANLCDILGVDVENVRRGIGSDPRIGTAFLAAGCGYGGSCFPKDVHALVRTAHHNDYEPLLLKAVMQRNELQKTVLFNKITARYGHDLSGMRFAVWGLAFKPGTDDMREASSTVMLHELIGAGATVCACDPVATTTARRELPDSWFEQGNLELVEEPYAALRDADAMLLITEWEEFRAPDFETMRGLMKQPVIFDGRNQYDRHRLRELGFDYFTIGRDAAP